VQLGKVLFIAALVEGLGLVANAVTSFITDRASGALRWIVPTAIALLLAMVKAAIDALGKEPAPEAGPNPLPYPYPPAPYPPAQPPYRSAQPPYPPAQPTRPPHMSTPVRRRSRGTPALVAILVALVVCGGGGLAITTGARYVVGWVTGKEDGTDRLVQAASARSGNVTLTVNRVLSTSHFTRVELTVQNSGSDSVTLPVYGNCTFTGAEGTVLAADPFRSQWSETVPPGALQRGTVTFSGKLPDEVARASLSFSHVFVLGGGAITVSGIALRPAA
jgi:hypothetical protein